MYYEDEVREILYSINKKIRHNSIDSIFRRGALAILELSGAVFLIKATILFNFESAIVGGTVLSISAVLEYLIWREMVAISQIVKENNQLRNDLSYLISRAPGIWNKRDFD